MDGFLSMLNDNAGALQVLFSALVTLATCVYAALTWSLVSETRRMRRAQTDAKVVVALDIRPQHFGFVDLVVRNDGVGPAYAVRFAVRSTQPTIGDESLVEKLQEFGFIESGIEYLSPSQEFRSYFANLRENHELKIATSITLDVAYTTASGEAISDKFILDFSAFRNMVQLGTPDLHSLAKSLESLKKDVGHLTSGWSKLQVITQSKEALRREQRESELEDFDAGEAERLAQKDVESGEV